MCPKCHNFKSDVIYTRQLRDTTLVRRRCCTACGIRYTTHERLYVPPPKYRA
jgi:transcriptional regulator NrdR family protein